MARQAKLFDRPSRVAIMDIETRCDKDRLMRTHPELIEGADESELLPDMAYAAYVAQRRKLGFSPMPPLACMIPICIGLGQVDPIELELSGLEVAGTGHIVDEDELARGFWKRYEAFGGCLVTFSGRMFDLPVLELRALSLGVSIPRHMEEGRHRYNSADRHLDLFEVLTNFGAARGVGGLEMISDLIGGPLKEEKAAEVQMLWDAGEFARIRSYCAGDILRTYLLFLRICVLRGQIPMSECAMLSENAKAKFGS